MGHTIDILRYRLRQSVLLQLIAANLLVWAALRIVGIAQFIGAGEPEVVSEARLCSWVGLLSPVEVWLSRPWGLLTYMFTQWEVLHLLFNMLWLYWFGRIYLEFSSERRLLMLYFIGGLAGGLLFLAAGFLPAFAGHGGLLVGSSASVLAIVTATALRVPDYPIGLLLIGTVRLKWIALVAIVFVLIGVTGTNAGGAMAHIGGIAAGAGAFYYSRTYKPRRRKRPVASKTTDANADLDELLDKIKRSGYAGLSASERKRLFEISSKLKDK